MQKSLKDSKASYRVVVKGLVKNANGDILLVRERSDTWDLPGGGLEHGEDLKVALEREFEEELSAKVRITSELHAFSTWNTKFDAPVLILAYNCSLVTQPSLTTDVSKFGYFSAEEIMSIELDSTLENGVLQKIMSAGER